MVLRIAHALLVRVYYELSAVVSLDSNREVLDVSLFDTRFAGEWMHMHPDAQEVWLLTNHPEGRRTLYDEDMRNIAMLRRKAKGMPMRVFITGEDTGAEEVTL